MNKINLIGQKFNFLEVKSLYESGSESNNWQSKWNCLCDCGNFCIKDTRGLKTGRSKSCGCYRKTWARNNMYKGYGNLSKSHWSQILRHAKDRNLLVEITIEDAWNLYLKQNCLCAITGIPIDFARNRNGENHGLTTASLDRIDPDKNYTIDNIQWVHKDINTMKWNHSQEYFIKLCKLVANNN